MTQPQDDKKQKQPARTHPDDRARIATLNAIGQTLRGTPAEKLPTSYYTPELIQCTLPHSDPKTPTWVRTNGNYSLVLASGADEKGEFIGLPYGSFPRLVLAYIITSVIHTGNRRMELSSHFAAFLKEIGYTGNLRGSTRDSKTMQNQLHRLLSTRITFQYREGDERRGAIAVKNVEIAPEFAFWWDYKNPDQGSLWGSYIELSEKFHQAILNAPVPLRTDILAALKKSPLALDVYMWVSYRLFTLQAAGQEEVTLGYGRLQEQFGTGIAEKNYRQFRWYLKRAFADVAKYWVSPDGTKEMLNYDLHEDGLTLYRSPLLITVPKRKIAAQAAAEEAGKILTSRKFDEATLKQARQAAGTQWDVRWLQNQYFTWIEQEGITPKDPTAHFLKFIKSHRDRNEKKT